MVPGRHCANLGPGRTRRGTASGEPANNVSADTVVELSGTAFYHSSNATFRDHAAKESLINRLVELKLP